MEAVIESIMGMGFERDNVIQALQAAFFNQDRAIEYLLNVSLGFIKGIPPEALQMVNEQGAQPPQQQQQGGGDSQNQGAGADSQNLLAGLSQEQIQSLGTLINNPNFEQLRRQAAANPRILPQIMAYLQQSVPDIYQVN